MEENTEQELEIMYRVTQSVYSLELDQVLEEIVALGIEVTHGDSCLIYLHNVQKKELVLRASKHPHPDLLAKIKIKIGEGITGWVAEKKSVVAIHEKAHEDKRFKLFQRLPEDTYEAFLSVPILVRQQVVGVINIQHRHIHHHTEREIVLLTAIGKLVGGAVENARLIEETLSLKEALEVRKRIDQAKGILMKKKSLSEQDAYKFLQDQSMKSRRSIREICDVIILAEQIMK